MPEITQEQVNEMIRAAIIRRRTRKLIALIAQRQRPGDCGNG